MQNSFYLTSDYCVCHSEQVSIKKLIFEITGGAVYIFVFHILRDSCAYLKSVWVVTAGFEVWGGGNIDRGDGKSSLTILYWQKEEMVYNHQLLFWALNEKCIDSELVM
jgi:hypothetical protein